MRNKAWIAGMTAVMAVGLVCMSPISARAESVIPAGVYVGSMSLEGMTAAEAEATVKNYVDARLAQTVTLDVNGETASASAKELGLFWANPNAVSEVLEDAKIEGNLIRQYMKKKDLQENPAVVELELDIDPEKINAFVNENCSTAIVEAQDAKIVRANGEFVITPSVTGIGVDMEATARVISEELLEDETDGVSASAVITETEPRITTEAVSEIKDLLGKYTTGFETSGWARSTNLEVGTAKINGRVLMPGDVLSGYECMAPLTLDNGYKMATAYENGRSVDSVAGGVCQIATTLYNAALNAELEIVQRQNHSMTVAYVDHSRDAAIAGTYKDIKISNPYDTPIYVEGYTSGKKLTFAIYGKETRPENRTIKFESKTLQWISPGDPIEEVDPTLQPGARVEVQSSHTGIRSELYKCIYIDGKLTERILLNKDNYNSSKAIYRVGPPAETVPTETIPTETAPAESAPVENTPTDVTPAGPGTVSGPGTSVPEVNGPGTAPSAGPAGPGEAANPTPAGPSVPSGAAMPQSQPSALGPGGTQGP